MNHDGQVSSLREAAQAVGARFNTVDCLGPCERGNVVVVRRGRDRQWFGQLGDAEVDTLSAWIAAPGGALPPDLEGHVFGGPSERAQRRLIPERGADLSVLLADFVAGPGRWTMGAPGAIAEFDGGAGADAVSLRSVGHQTDELSARTPTGAMRLTIGSKTRLFAFGSEVAPEEIESYTLVATGTGLTPNRGLTELGEDADALIGSDPGILFDFGLERPFARFMVRVADPALVATLRGLEGTVLDDLEPPVLDALIDASPTRVVETALGRVEIATPITVPGEPPPSGSRTYLRPDILALGLDVPPGVDIPKGWQVGPSFFPRAATEATLA